MSEPIKMPQLGESVTEGTIARWLKAEGEDIELDEPIVEIDTDKVSSELPSPLAGKLEKILVGEGDTVDVGVEIATVAIAGESPNGGSPEVEAPADGEAAEWPVADTAAQPVAAGGGESPSAVARGGNGGGSATKTAEELRLTRSSPVVRRLAAEHGVSIGEISGTGIGGRVTKKDIEAYVEGRVRRAPPGLAEEREYFAPPEPTKLPPPSSPEPSPVESYPGDESIPLTSMRRAIANRMSTSKREAPHAWSMVEVDMTGLVKLREAHKEAFKAREGVGLTYLPFIVKAVVESLKEYPVVNSVWDGDAIVLRRSVNIGVAVDIEDGENGALIVPVVKDADNYGIVGLARKSAEVIKKARSKQLSPDDIAEGTFTVNNPGALGSVVSVPIINHPQAAILSAEAIVKRPVVMEEWGDAIVVRSMMNLEISFDHRIFDGGVALRFLNAIKNRLESYGPRSSIG
ncbi:MAG: 2-oxo acid dehydrogenase subunit E2 [Rubrobacter sp.]|nr:2-oxo acid dehydrogenase subunit E2 [Rubrobacter sp.]